jgi:hypothetical protein
LAAYTGFRPSGKRQVCATLQRLNFLIGSDANATPGKRESWLIGWPAPIRRVQGDLITMKFAAYTEETIWAVEETEAAARSEGEASMRDNDASAKLAEMKIAPIDDDLVEALANAEAGGGEVLFDLIDGELCEVETVES